MRISGINIPENKTVKYSLQYIKGIGLHRATEICKQFNIADDVRTKDLTDEQVGKIDAYISRYITVGDELNRVIVTNIKNKMSLNGFSGYRLKAGLPRHGSGRSAGKTARKIFAGKVSAKKKIGGK